MSYVSVLQFIIDEILKNERKDILCHLIEEVAELEDALSVPCLKEYLEDELADVLNMALALNMKYLSNDIEVIFSNCIRKFIKTSELHMSKEDMEIAYKIL